MGMTLAFGKVISWKGDNIGIDTIVDYTDQNNNKVKVNVKKFVELAGEKAQAFHHSLVIVPKKDCFQSDLLFVETKKDRVYNENNKEALR